jgi:S1-C subfamily serine protease
MRYGQRKTFRVTLMEAKTDEVASAAVPASTGSTGVLHPALGISVAPVSPEIAAQARLTSPVRGVLVSEVTPGGPGDQKLFRNDVITDVLFPAPRRAVNTPADLQQVLNRLKNGDYVSLNVYSLDDRNHAPRIVNLQLGN